MAALRVSLMKFPKSITFPRSKLFLKGNKDRAHMNSHDWLEVSRLVFVKLRWFLIHF